MKIVLRYLISITMALLVSWFVFNVTFEFIEYANPSKRYNELGEPEFVMPIAAIFFGFFTSIVSFIVLARWINKILKNKYFRIP